MDSIVMRLAKETDAEAIMRIYRPYVENTAVSFETDAPGTQEMCRRMREVQEAYPYIVCEADELVVGFAYAHRHRERAAYGWNAELSIYIDERHIGCGLGKRMYGLLIEILKLQNIQNVYAGITLPNEKSAGLHRSMGFSLLGMYSRTGYKLDRWHDVALYEMHIGDHGAPPRRFVGIRDIDAAQLGQLVRTANEM